MDRQAQLDTTREHVIDATEARKPPRFYECGICGCWHSIAFNGDCRDDSNRCAADEIDDALGSFSWEAVEMPA
jgi:hypothetical protein